MQISQNVIDGLDLDDVLSGLLLAGPRRGLIEIGQAAFDHLIASSLTDVRRAAHP